MPRLDASRTVLLKYWFPALASGLVTWFLFLILENAPIVRASGLALVVVGVGLALRRMGAAFAFLGSMTLALSPAFWSQGQGGVGSPATIIIAVVMAGGILVLAVIISHQPSIGFGLGVLVFALFFWSQIGTERSLRLTSFVVAWLMYLLVDMLLIANPRSDDAAPPILKLRRRDGSYQEGVQSYHTYGILLLLVIGILNDPLLTLLIPAIVMGLVLSSVRVPFWYWLGLGAALVLGLRGIGIDYIELQARWLSLDAWRHADRWIDMVEFVIAQFSIIGVFLGALGLARLARWYPPLGTTTMLAYAAYTFFGLVFDGPGETALLLPLLVIQITWMTYAVFALSEWLVKSNPNHTLLARGAVQMAYAILPGWLLIQILTIA